MSLESHPISEQKSLARDGKTSRIKFKSVSTSRTSTSRTKVPQPQSSRNTMFSSSMIKASAMSFVSDDEINELLDPNNCFHPQCSFAYSVTGDMKRPSLIVECLPLMVYKRLASLWGLDPQKAPLFFSNKCKMEDKQEEEKFIQDFFKEVEKDIGMQSDISEDLHINIGSIGEETREVREERKNPYLKFARRAELHSKRDILENLGRKVGKITKKIIKNFLDWYQCLGGNDDETFIEESTLLEFFQIGFDTPAARSISIRIKELPCVPESLAYLRHEPKHAIRYGLKQFLKKDIKLESIPEKMFAFGSMLPKEKPSLRYKPPSNAVKKTWMECARVPSDLDTMKTVWGGLERLRSTIAFSNWLKNHPEITPPHYLQAKGLLEINYEEWNIMYKGFELDADAVETFMSDLKLEGDKSAMTESQFSAEDNMKFESVDSFM